MLEHTAAVIAEKPNVIYIFYFVFLSQQEMHTIFRFKWYHKSHNEKEGSPDTFSSSAEPPNQRQAFQLFFLKFASVFLNATLVSIPSLKCCSFKTSSTDCFFHGIGI